ncbi:MAG TPA: hypothetical protein VM408_06655 [Methylomirabilota bacterium]|nr:hypothetical protein [Methylomirabilota bacterium]
MREAERLRGIRVVADPAALDALVAALPARTSALRFAPDEALVLGLASVHLDDPDAIVEDESGFVAFTVERAEVERHIEWALPDAGAIAQGSVAGVPAKLTWLPDGRAWVVTPAAYADELASRLR